MKLIDRINNVEKRTNIKTLKYSLERLREYRGRQKVFEHLSCLLSIVPAAQSSMIDDVDNAANAFTSNETSISSLLSSLNETYFIQISIR